MRFVAERQTQTLRCSVTDETPVVSEGGDTGYETCSPLGE